MRIWLLCLTYTYTGLKTFSDRSTDHETRLYPQKLALISPTSGGRSVGIVRSRTKATELVRGRTSHILCKSVHLI
jgi:hypothetical protein